MDLIVIVWYFILQFLGKMDGIILKVQYDDTRWKIILLNCAFAYFERGFIIKMVNSMEKGLTSDKAKAKKVEQI